MGHDARHRLTQVLVRHGPLIRLGLRLALLLACVAAFLAVAARIVRKWYCEIRQTLSSPRY